MSLPFHRNHSILGDYAAFTDESGLAADRYLLIGGLSCRTAAAHSIANQILAIHAERPFPEDSLQWKSITQRKIDKYKHLIDLFFELNRNHVLDFTCLVADNSKMDHHTFNAGDGETGFQKMMYQTYMAILRKYRRPEVLRCFHGKRDSVAQLSDFQDIFNSGASLDISYGRSVFYRPLRQMEYMKVEKSPLHIMADLILGAVSWHWNRKRRGGPQTPKGMVAEYVRNECPHSTLNAPTPATGYPHFHIWEFRLRDPRA